MASTPWETFLRKVREVRRTGQATAEQSFYPAVNALLDEAARGGDTPRRVLAHPAGHQGNLPDVAIYEVNSNVLALPVEVKPASTSIETLIGSKQARSYAETFGGGRVLLTNLREWVLAELDGGTLRRLHTVTLADSDAALDHPLTGDYEEAWRKFRMVLVEGCEVRGNHRSPKTVASLLAFHASNMRDAINRAGDPVDLLSSINNALSRGLHIELDAQHLTPTVVQTLVYGSFAAWLSAEDPQRFDWMQASYRLTVPVFAEILHEALRPALLRRCDLTQHLNAVERVLRWTDRDAFTGAFDGDAIQYFYEPFLAEFDENLRNALGVWYTPAEIAAYQVRRAHHHLITDLGVTDGLADPTVYLLDPACGTGTYLIAACDFLFGYHTGNGEPPSVAAERIMEAMTTRFIGFEILPAAFIICHLHLSRHLHHLGAVQGERRLRVYLTNSLTGWRPEDAATGLTLFPELEEELHDAAIAKQHDPVMVVLGNPPYQGYSTAETDEERAMLAPWVTELTTTWGLQKHRMNDLYVRFWKIAIHRIVTLTNRGVVSFITNRKWLGGRSYPSMRATVVTDFHTVWVDDLHGSSHDRSHPGDQSIFTTAISAGIKTGTAIVTAVRNGTPTGDTTVHLADYRGAATTKRQALFDRSTPEAMTAGYIEVNATFTSRYRLATDSENDYPSLDEYLQFFRSGVQPVREEAVLAFDKPVLEARMRDYFDEGLTFAQVTEKHPGFAVVRARYDATGIRARLLRESAYDAAKITRFLFKPFDTRWMYWETTAKLLNEPRRELVPYWRNAPGQVCLVAPQTPRRVGAVRPYASGAVGGYHSTDPDARVFPLYNPTSALVADTENELALDVVGTTAPTTVAPTWVHAAAAALGIDDEKEAGEAVFYAIVAITQSPLWLADQPVESDDFATLPLPGDKTTLTRAAATGRALVALMDPDVPVTGVTTGMIHPHLQLVAVAEPLPGVQPIDTGQKGQWAGRRDGTTVFWAGDHGWRNIPDEVWAYSIGGFQVLPKWLSYRKQGGLTPEDRETFRILCRRIHAIIDLASDCDALYQAAQQEPLGIE